MPKSNVRTRRLAATLTVATAAAAALTVPGPSVAADERGGTPSLRGFGLTSSDVLVRFPVDSPGILTRIGPVTGLIEDISLVGMDFRVQDGLLYGVGNLGGVYTISRSTGAATPVSQLTVPLTGTQFGVDFNPAADALRVISDQSQNLRHSVVTDTTTADTPLTNPAVPPAPAAPATGVTMAGYTNNDLDSGSGTTLFDIDTDLDRVAIQAPANSGTLNPTGTIGRDALAGGDIDVYSYLSGTFRTERNVMYGAIRPTGMRSQLFLVDPLTGTLTSRGTFGDGAAVVDVALPLNQA